MVLIKNLNISEINIGKARFSEIIKILFLKKNEELISLLDLDKEDIFLNSFLFAYFNDADAENKVTLEQLVYGYISNEYKPSFISVIVDENGVLYLPNIGYFRISDILLLNKTCKFYYNDGNYKITYNNHQVEYEFHSLIFADTENKIELIQYQHPLLKSYFKVLRADYTNQNDKCEVEVKCITTFHIDNIKKAFLFIKNNFPLIYETIIASNKYVMIFGNQAMLPFATRNTLGISYISSLYTDSYLFFVEEILHQCSHNLFNLLNYDRQKYFKIDVEVSTLGEYIKNPNEKRTIYNVFHGLITITQRLICYKYIIENKLLTGIDLHEIIGRYCDLYRRHHSGLEMIELDIVYTNDGVNLYKEMDSLCEQSLNYFRIEAKRYNVINQPAEFNFQQFLVLNPYKNK